MSEKGSEESRIKVDIISQDHLDGEPARSRCDPSGLGALHLSKKPWSPRAV